MTAHDWLSLGQFLMSAVATALLLSFKGGVKMGSQTKGLSADEAQRLVDRHEERCERLRLERASQVDQRLSAMQDRIEDLHDKASREGTRLQVKIGEMEMKMVESAAKLKAHDEKVSGVMDLLVERRRIVAPRTHGERRREEDQ